MHRHEQHTLTDEWQNLREQGFFRVTVAGRDTVFELSEQDPETIKPEQARILVDRLIWKPNDEANLTRIAESIETAFSEGAGKVIIAKLAGNGKTVEYPFSARFECSVCGLPYEEPDPRLFSFNSPYGACQECEGFGRSIGIDMDLVVPDKSKTIKQGAIACWTGQKFSSYQRELLSIAPKTEIRVNVPYAHLTEEEKQIIWEGYGKEYDGLKGFFRELETHTYKLHYRVILSRYRGYTTCSKCHGSRLRPAAHNIKVHEKTIHEVVRMTIEEAHTYFDSLALTAFEHTIADRIMLEIQKRLRYLDDVGLGYLTLDRLSHTLSGGESQRIQLASSLGGALTGTLYVLDEPSIGLHQRDTERLLTILKRVRDLGNTVVVVEHDEDVIRASDHIVDFGPQAGERGGEIV
jgi:excinuclease ABC subunit A